MAIAPLTSLEYEAAQDVRRELLAGVELLEPVPDSHARLRLGAMLQQLDAAMREYEARGLIRRRFPPRPPGVPRLRQVLEDEADLLIVDLQNRRYE